MPVHSRLPFREIVSYAFVALCNTLVGLAIIFFLKAAFSTHDILANAVGYSLGSVMSYFLNARWTFLYRGPLGASVPAFLMVTAIAYLTNLATVAVAIYVAGINGYVAQALGVGPFALIGYLGSKYFVFVQPPVLATDDSSSR